MSITATELKSNLGKYLLLAATEDILLQSGKHGGFIKAVAQLPRRDGLRAVWREIGKPSAALLNSHAVLQQLPRKILDGERFVQRFSDDLTQLFLVGFKVTICFF